MIYARKSLPPRAQMGIFHYQGIARTETATKGNSRTHTVATREHLMY